MSVAESSHREGAGVTAVIPTFNRAADLERSLGHLALQSVGPINVIVVDNSSTDATPEMIQRLMPAWGGRLSYIRREPNGPASARNTGLAATTTPYVLFLDSDIDLAGDWVERALGHLSDDLSLGAVGGLVLYAFDPATVNAYGGDLGRVGLAWDVDEGCPLAAVREPSVRIWINCSAMLGHTDIVRVAGGFDERFFYGHEDTDLGWRLSMLGRPPKVFPDLKALHNVSADPGYANSAIVFHSCKNRLRSMLKNASTASLPAMLLGYLAYTAADLVLRAPRRAKLSALTWNVSHLAETLALRRAVQRSRVVDDSVVFGRGSRRWFPPTRLAGRRRRAVHGPNAQSSQIRRADADDRV